MEVNWKEIEKSTPKCRKGYNYPLIPCVVYACNPDMKIGGVIETCRWDVKNNEWFQSDIETNWFLHHPYKITHFSDTVKGPY